MKHRSSIVVALALGAVALLSLSAALDYYRSVTVYNIQNPDPYRIGFQDPRFREVKAAVPVDSVVGYLSDLPLDDLRGGTAFAGTQYALAPRVLVARTSRYKQDWVLGNFSTTVDVAAIAAENKLRIVKDFGAGVVLFQREAR